MEDQELHNIMLRKKQIDKILRKYKEIFEALESYDRTRELPFQRKRIDITLPVSAINRLRNIRLKTGKPISKIIEESLNKKVLNA